MALTHQISVRLRLPPQNFEAMERRLRFFKQDNKWYADIPNHTLEENEMVMGSDTALDYLSNGKNEVFITVTDTDPGWNAPLIFHRKEHDEDGAYYTMSGILFMDFLDNFAQELIGTRPEIWICNVTHDVFGEHPERIYVLKVE